MLRQRGGQRGAIIVEAAIVVPLLVLIVTGLVEFGMAWRVDNLATRTTRTAIMELARSGVQREADFRAIDLMRTSIPDRNDIEWLIVYRVPADELEPPSDCVDMAEAAAAANSGIDGTCNIYRGDYVQAATAGDFVDASCLSEPDRWLCPPERPSSLAPEDRIGIAVSISNPWWTGLLPGDGLVITDHATSPLLTSLGDVG